VSAFVLLENPQTGQITQGQDSSLIKVVGS
jgi:hypothetical protein